MESKAGVTGGYCAMVDAGVETRLQLERFSEWKKKKKKKKKKAIDNKFSKPRSFKVGINL